MYSLIKSVIFASIVAFGFNSGADIKPPSFNSDQLNSSVQEYNNFTDLVRRDLGYEDEQREAEGLPPRFALPSNTVITPYSHGTWESLNKTQNVWRLKVNSKRATSVNIGFTSLYLPKSASVYVYSPDMSQVRGPFTGEVYNELKELWTPVILGDQMIVELVVNKDEQEDVMMILGSVNHGYRGFGTKSFDDQKSGSCNVDVACEISAGWEDQIKSVAVISTGGSTFCTGFLVNNANNDQKPLFMTANHCGIRNSNAASLVAYWQYENTTCRDANSAASGSSGDGQLDQFTSGATFKARGDSSDYAIVEFNEAIDPDFDVFYAGWDARDGDPSQTTAIHHPNTDEKRISFDYDPATTTFYSDASVQPDGTHIRVADWDVGTTEPGSSGSPLFDQNQRIVGQLHGGRAACGNNAADWYGRISYSWNDGLKEVLDPDNTGTMFVDGIGTEIDFLVSSNLNGFDGLSEDDFVRPGQILNGVVTLENKGLNAVTDLNFEMTSNNEMVTIEVLDTVSDLAVGESQEVNFVVTVSEDIECGSSFEVSYTFENDNVKGAGSIESDVGGVVFDSSSTEVSIDIPDNSENGARVTLDVNSDSLVSGLIVGLDITHSYIGDLLIQLISPQGTVVTLHRNGGGGDSNIVGEYPTTLSSVDALSVLDGERFSGEWTLFVRDQEGQDVGKINSFEVKVEKGYVCE